MADQSHVHDHERPAHDKERVSYYEPQGKVDSGERVVMSGSTRLVVRFVGGTAFVRREDGSIDAVHPKSTEMPHFSHVFGRYKQWTGPRGATDVPAGFPLSLIHPHLSGPSDGYWVWCPQGRALSIDSAFPAVQKKADKLVVLRRHFTGEILSAFTSKQANFQFHLRGGILDDDPPVNRRAAQNFWYFEGHKETPLVLNDVTRFTLQSDHLVVGESPTDGEEQHVLPAGLIELFVVNLTLQNSSVPEVIHHHMIARVLAKDPAQFDSVPMLISPTIGGGELVSIGIRPLCSDEPAIASPPDSEFCVNSEL